ncbi:MMPL family transporter [Actinocatenispora rupis]|uniref:Putative membrane protein ActII-3 n=1 Tax=Actinocatenispora rupis TaxID=519421 RepID=A0A8J3NB31_9ACTN|nr:MMPL family transporter [Actinocatenispora rupis]GID12949.1 putative membrane protein ActII-3 [Actinocatenispora rupis]
MSRALGRIGTGKWSRFAVVLFWLVVVAALGSMAGKLTGVEKNEAKSWLPGSAESTQVLAVQSRFSSPNTLPAVLVYTRSTGLTRADLVKAAADARAFGRFGSLDGKVVGPVPSRDGKAAQTVIPLNLGSNGWSKAGTEVDRIRTIATAGAAGMTVHVTGPAGSAADSSKAFSGIDSTLLYATVGVVVVILLLTYRSPMLWLLPVVSAGVALAVAQGVIYLLARYAHLTVNAQSAGILTVLVFGAGTDYALLLIARYREELRRHTDRREAMAVALHRAGPAILASGCTVIVGMLCLLVAETNSTRGLGPVAAIGIFVALAVMLTLLPALLVIVGRWVFWPAVPRYGSPEPTSRGLWARTGARIARRPRWTWITTAVVLGTLSIGLVTLDATGLTNAESYRGHPDSVAGERALAAHFPAGAGSPVVVVAHSARATAVRAAFATTQGIDPATVTPPISRGGTAYLQGTLTSAPDSQAAYDTIDRVRDRVHAIPDAHAQVGGNTAINLDVQRAAARDRNLIIPIVLAVVFVILALLLRAVLGPLILIGTVVLSFAAALGASALVFRYVFGFGGADTSLPLFVFVFLVALGIDYNIFLMTRVREESARVGTRRAAVVGLAATGGVITSAGLVLAGTFAVLATLPLTAFAEIGFAVALGVLLDTIVVRSILVTALNLDIGRHIWWPGKLSRAPEAGSVETAGEPSRVGR